MPTSFPSFLTHRRLLLALSLAGLLAGPAQAQVTASFAPPLSYSAPGTSGIAVADLNSDGQPDVATVSYNNNTVEVLLGINPANGGGFQPVQRFSTGAGSQPRNVTVADVNNDGLLDLITANSSTSSAGVLLGKSAASGGGFEPVQQYQTEPQTLYRTTPFAIAVADVNSDGLPDLLAANFGTNSVGVLLGKSAATGGGFQSAQVYSTGSGSLPSDIEVADLNSDGVLDLVTANSDDNGVGVLLGKSAASGGGFAPVQPYATTSSFAYPFKVAVADVNLDGLLDLVTANTNNNTVGVLLGRSAASGGGFAPFQNYTTINRKPYDIAVADVNGDGLPDLLVSQASSTIGILFGKSAASGGGFQPVQEVTGGGGTLKVADVNADGRPDLITDGVVVLLNTIGSPTLTTSPATTITTTSATLSGTLLSTSTGALTEYGVVYASSTNLPTISDTKVLVSSSLPATLPSTFSASLMGLRPGSTYTVRAYAINSVGTGYGNAVSFSTPLLTTAAPVLTTPAASSAGRNRQPTFAGTAPAGSFISLFLATGSGAAQFIGTTTATGSSFSFSPTAVLPDGTYRAYVTAQSANATVSAPSPTIPFTIDGTAPTVTSLTSPAGTSGTTTSTAPFAFSVTFSESVTGLSASGISVNNGSLTSGPLGSGTAGTTFTFTVAPTTLGIPTTVTLLANAVQDAVGNGNTASGAYSLTYSVPVAFPTVTMLSPATGPVGTSVTITGTNLSGTTAVSFNGTLARSFVVNSATSLTAVVAAGTTTGPVQVTTPSGSASSATNFGVRVAPTTVADAYTTPQGVLLTGNVLANDVGTNPRAILIIRPTHGTLVLNPDGSFTYQPAAGYVGLDSFLYYACDLGTPLLCGDPVTVSLNVGRVAPTTVADMYTTPAGVMLTGNVLSNDLGTNPVAILIIRPTHGTLVLNPDGSFTYQPAAGYTGPDSFIYYACNLGTPLVCGDPATVSLTVVPATGTRIANSPKSTAPTTKPDAETVGVAELLLTGSPNPFSEYVRLTFALPLTQAYTLTVYDAQGRLVQQLASGQAEASQAQLVEVPTRTYAAGLYLVRLATATGVRQLKLIKQ